MSDDSSNLVDEIVNLVEKNRQVVAISVNYTLTNLYWTIGSKIKNELKKSSKEDYGKEIIDQLSKELEQRYGKGFNRTNLFNCIRLNDIFPSSEIIHAVSGQLSWTHLRKLIYIEPELKREFYIQMCKYEKWSTRTLDTRIKSMLYERTALSKKPKETIRQELLQLETEKKITPDLIFKDPYFLDFLGLKDTYSEKDLENAILAELQRFLIELGNDFAFLARQKRITIDHTDYYIDLLFYHRRLKCLVVIDLKLGEFEAAYKGQMELYLRYLEKYEKVEGENPPIGLVLCSGKNEEHVELLQLEQSNIRVAEYLTVLPSIKLLKQRLQQAIFYAHQRNNQ